VALLDIGGGSPTSAQLLSSTGCCSPSQERMECRTAKGLRSGLRALLVFCYGGGGAVMISKARPCPAES
jgi:hypothetical protein